MTPITPPDLQEYCREKLGDKFQEFRFMGNPQNPSYELQILTTDNCYSSRIISAKDLGNLHYKSIDAFVINKIDEMIEELLA